MKRKWTPYFTHDRSATAFGFHIVTKPYGYIAFDFGPFAFGFHRDQREIVSSTIGN